MWVKSLRYPQTTGFENLTPTFLFFGDLGRRSTFDCWWICMASGCMLSSRSWSSCRSRTSPFVNSLVPEKIIGKSWENLHQASVFTTKYRRFMQFLPSSKPLCPGNSYGHGVSISPRFQCVKPFPWLVENDIKISYIYTYIHIDIFYLLYIHIHTYTTQYIYIYTYIYTYAICIPSPLIISTTLLRSSCCMQFATWRWTSSQCASAPVAPPWRPLWRKSPADTLWLCQNSYWKWPFIVDLPIKNGDFP